MGSEHHPVMMLGLAETSNNLLLGNLPSIRPEPRCADGSPARELLAALEAFSMVEPSQDIVVADPESEQSELEWLRRELKSARLHIAELQAELLAKPTRSHSTRPFRPFESTKPSQSARPSRCTTPSYSTALSHSARPSQCPARCARGRVRTLCRAESRALRCGARVTRPVCTSPHAHPHMHVRRGQYVCLCVQDCRDACVVGCSFEGQAAHVSTEAALVSTDDVDLAWVVELAHPCSARCSGMCAGRSMPADAQAL